MSTGPVGVEVAGVVARSSNPSSVRSPAWREGLLRE
jgi:hypothetical protein